MEWTIDTCPCLTTQPTINIIPDVSWTIGDPPVDYQIGYNYPDDPAWPSVDRSINDCWGTFAVTDTSGYTDVIAITGPATTTGVVSLQFEDSTSDLDATVFDSLTAYSDGVMLEFTVTVTITTPTDYDSPLWYVDESSGASALTVDYTFNVQLLEPCTQSAIVYDTYLFAIDMAFGDIADSSSVATMTPHTYPTYCGTT